MDLRNKIDGTKQWSPNQGIKMVLLCIMTQFGRGEDKNYPSVLTPLLWHSKMSVGGNVLNIKFIVVETGIKMTALNHRETRFSVLSLCNSCQ